LGGGEFGFLDVAHGVAKLAAADNGFDGLEALLGVG
jgi:hypothetical protein